MSKQHGCLLSVVVPLYNESDGLQAFHTSLLDAIPSSAKDTCEIVYCDDGSLDATADLVTEWATSNKQIRLIKLSRNFGKEMAITAGIHEARGEAIITLDADGQHPVELISEFVKSWEAGNKVVIGIRTANQKEGFIKRYGSKLFYKLFNRFTGVKLIPGTTDFRLIDRLVRQEFIRMTERNRISRGLIDWLGYNPAYIEFIAKPRLAGETSYSFKKLFKLAVDSVISLSISPLYVTAYIGAFVLPISILLGLFMAIDVLLGDPFHIHATGSAYVMMLLLFLVGVLLVSQGIIGLYLSHIHAETQNRPLYIINKGRSIGLNER